MRVQPRRTLTRSHKSCRESARTEPNSRDGLGERDAFFFIVCLLLLLSEAGIVKGQSDEDERYFAVNPRRS